MSGSWRIRRPLRSELRKRVGCFQRATGPWLARMVLRVQYVLRHDDELSPGPDSLRPLQPQTPLASTTVQTRRGSEAGMVGLP